MPQTLLRLPDLTAKTGLGRSAVYARITPNPKRPNDYDPTFPKPIKIGGRAVAWLESEVDAWIAQRISSNRKEAA